MSVQQPSGAPRPRWSWALRDAWVLSGRGLRRISRSPEELMLMLFLPTTLLLMFRYLFGGAIDTGDVTYVNYVVAGIIVVSIAFNATTTSVAVANDMLEGIVERFRSMPMVSAVVLVGHVAAAMLRNLVSIVVMVGVGLLVGFRPVAGAGQWLIALGLLALFALAVSWLAVVLGLLARTVEGASGMAMPLVFVPYVGSAFVPPSTMPPGLRAFAEDQPVSVVVDAVRALFMGTPLGNTAWLAALWWAGILLVVVPLAGRLFRRRSLRG
ncbi:ABC-2 type transport system permease protein [Saccharomonospora amisosensis]|uniref:Transport permease protein n=1 Tax=Saccharomonospora amisosensis TaxID=1128677 RepID=A0A7X5UQI4_9PSEU|nr:ABC transporter permease [Saccharomonospora amisosensis]NIJ12364.1 ABC-2 type transport system permease protein [Saccharomonospora amisosensis]